MSDVVCYIELTYTCSASCLHRWCLLSHRLQTAMQFSVVQLRDPVPGIFSAEMMVGSLNFSFLNVKRDE